MWSFQITVNLTNLKYEVPGLMWKIESKVASEELPGARNQSYKSKKEYLNMFSTLGFTGYLGQYQRCIHFDS